jgi:hypothetical protein
LIALAAAFALTAPAIAQTPTFTTLTVQGATTLNAGGAFTGTFTYTGTGSAITPSTDTKWGYTYNGSNPTGEARPWQITANADYTGGANGNVTLGIDAELNTIVGTFPFGSTSYTPQNAGAGEHQSALYGHSTLRTAPAMFGCTPGTNCPGTTFATNGVNAFADNVSTGELFSARSIIVHSPTKAKSFTANGYSAGNGGTIDMWSALSSDDARSGIDVGQAVGIIVGANTTYLNNGFGAAQPIAHVHARCGNRTDTATGWVSGNTLYLATSPATALAMGPGNVVTGTGGFVSAHLMQAVSTAPVAGVTPGGFIAYLLDGAAQTVGSQASPVTLTFTETCIPIVANNFSSGGLATIGFIGGSSATNAILASIDQGSDSTVPLGNYLDFQVNGAISAYVYSQGGARPAGMAIGFTAPPASIPLDALWVNGSTMTDILRVNASGATSITTTGNVGIGVGRVAVASRLVVKGPDTTSTTLQLQDSNGVEAFRVQANGAIISVGRIQVTSMTATAAPAATSAGQVAIGGTTGPVTSCGSLAGSNGCLAISVAGTTRYVPFY